MFQIFYLMSDFSKEMHPQFSLVGFKNGLIDVSTQINASCLITSIHPRPLPPVLLGLYWTPLKRTPSCLIVFIPWKLLHNTRKSDTEQHNSISWHSVSCLTKTVCTLHFAPVRKALWYSRCAQYVSNLLPACSSSVTLRNDKIHFPSRLSVSY